MKANATVAATGADVFMPWNSGVIISGGNKKVWPARVRAPGDGGEKVQKARKPGRILVQSYGDNAFVWVKPKTLDLFEVAKAEAAMLATATKAVKAALRLAVEAQGGSTILRTGKTKTAAMKTAGQTKTPRKTKSAVATPALAAVATPAKPAMQKRAREDEDANAGLSEYELKRKEQIEENNKIIEALGLKGARDALSDACTPPKRGSLDPAVLAARAQARAARLAEAHANRRSSSRLTADGDGGGPKAPVRFADEYCALEEAERVIRLPKKKRSKVTGARVEESVLSEAERAAVAAAHVEASGWLKHMERWVGGRFHPGSRRSVLTSAGTSTRALGEVYLRRRALSNRYFKDKISEANLRNVMKVTTALATGVGVPHTVRIENGSIAMWRKGRPITLDEDLVALRVEANLFLSRDDDPSNGWRIDHPLGKMAIFQYHLHSRRAKA